MLSSTGPRNTSLLRLLIVFFSTLLCVVLGAQGLIMYAHWLWFEEVGYTDVYLTVLWTRVKLFLVFTGAWFVILAGCWHRAKRVAPLAPTRGVEDRPQFISDALVERLLRGAVPVAAVGISVSAGLLASARYFWFLKSHNPTAFHLNDPVFHKDVAFYVFQLPWWRYEYSSLFAAFFVALIGSALLFIFRDAIAYDGQKVWIAPAALRHTGELIAVLLLLKAVGHHLAAWNLVVEQHGISAGASPTDTAVRLPILRLLTVLAIASGLHVLLLARHEQPAAMWKPVAAYLGVNFLGGIVALLIYVATTSPEMRQRMEHKHAALNAKFTRFAYALDTLQEQSELTKATANRLQREYHRWREAEHRQLDKFRQEQRGAFCYEFLQMDTDRYQIAGKATPVRLAARELDYGLFDRSSWESQHAHYTHGYGLCLIPSNAPPTSTEPPYLIKDIPLVTAPSCVSLRVKRPEIYFGEWRPPIRVTLLLPGEPHHAEQRASSPHTPTGSDAKTSSEPVLTFLDIPTPQTPDVTEMPHAIVHTTKREIHFVRGKTCTYGNYEGRAGVRISGFLRRLAFALCIPDWGIVTTNAITPGSRILINRHIIDRARQIAPFLRYDDDAYIVVARGRLVWVIDAYTTSHQLPYATRAGNLGNYLRNSAKVTVDAYDGTTTFYRTDVLYGRTDPVIETCARIFPSLFRPIEEMPKELRTHLRYPKGLLVVQSVFCSPREATESSTLTASPAATQNSSPRLPLALNQTAEPAPPVYLRTQLPGSIREEFVLVTPVIARNGSTADAWLTAGCDGPEYGRTKLWRVVK